MKTFVKRKDLYDPEKIKEMIVLYNSGESCAKIGKIYKCAATTISKILKENGVNVINRQNIVTYTDDEIIDDYCNKHLSLTQISKNRNTDRHLVAQKLRSYGIEVKNFHNEPKFNEHVFDEIDTEEKAY